jgi:hypothetical protein
MQIVEVLISNGLPISVRFKIGRSTMSGVHQATMASRTMSYGPPGPTTSVGTRTDYSVGHWDYSTWATRHLLA